MTVLRFLGNIGLFLVYFFIMIFLGGIVLGLILSFKNVPPGTAHDFGTKTVEAIAILLDIVFAVWPMFRKKMYMKLEPAPVVAAAPAAAPENPASPVGGSTPPSIHS